MIELKPCPFCGSRRVDIDTDDHPNPKIIDHVMFVRCDDCGARGSDVAIRGAVNPEKTARLLWDMRDQ